MPTSCRSSVGEEPLPSEEHPPHQPPPRLVVVDYSFLLKGHHLSQCKMLAKECQRLGWQLQVLIPSNVPRHQLPATIDFQPVLPAVHLGQVATLKRMARIFWILLRLEQRGQVYFWPLPSSGILLTALSLLRHGLKVEQAFVITFSPHRRSRVHALTTWVACQLAKLSNRLGWPWRFYASTPTVERELRKAGWPISSTLLTFGRPPVQALTPPNQSLCTSFCYLGTPRQTDSKGLRFLCDALYGLRSCLEERRMRWVIQVERNPHIEAAPAIERLFQDPLPGIQLLEGHQPDEVLDAQLRDSHFTVVPYDPEFYMGAPSGLVCESLAAGRPVIGTLGTWTEEMVKQTGCGLLCRYGDVAGLQQVLMQAVEQREALCQQAWDQCWEWQQRFSPQTFINKILYGEANNSRNSE